MTVERRFGYVITADGSYIGYRVDGDGPIDLVHQPEWPGNIDMDWEEPWWAAWLGELATIRYRKGSPMLQSEDGLLFGLVSIDVAAPSLGEYVRDARRGTARSAPGQAGRRSRSAP